MNTQAVTARGRLELAEALLRDVVAHDLSADDTTEAGSLQRILVYLVNMQRAITGSPDGHANIAKRLADFALTMSRINRRRPAASLRLTRLTDALNLASVSLKDSEPLPA